MTGGNNLHQILIAFIVLCQKDEVVIFPMVIVLQFVVIVPCHIYLTSQNGFHTWVFSGEFHKLLDAKHIAVVSDGKGRHPKFLGTVKKF